jgi:hypothetical protein
MCDEDTTDSTTVFTTLFFFFLLLFFEFLKKVERDYQPPSRTADHLFE